MKLETFFEHFDLLAEAPNGVQKLRELILDLAVRGKLVTQDANDEPAAVLLERIKEEKERLVKEKKIKLSKSLLTIESKEIPFELKLGWKWVRIGEICSQVTDGVHSTPKYTESGIPFLSVNNLRNNQISFVGCKYISTEEHLELIKRCNPEKGDVLLGKVGSIGVCDVIDFEKEFSIFVQLALLKPSKLFLNSFYLKYSILSETIKTQIISGSAGSALQYIGIGKIQSIIIPIPPLAEQKRIVTKVNELMKLCDELEARQKKKRETRILINNAALNKLLTADTPETFTKNWQCIGDNFDILYSAPENIGKLRQAILQLAVMGKLVPQDANDEPAAVLLERIKKEKERLVKEGKVKKEKSLPAIKDDEIPYDLPIGWEWLRLESICSKITDGVHKTPKYTDYGIPFLSVTQLKNGRLDFSHTKYISPVDHQTFYQRCDPQKGDVLICKVGGTIGVTAVVEVDIEFSIFVQLALVKQIFVNSYYLKYLLLSNNVQNYIKENSVGSAMPYISLEKLKYIQVPLPPLNEQKRIVSKVDKLMKLCDELETKLTQTQTESEKIINAAVKQLLTV